MSKCTRCGLPFSPLPGQTGGNKYYCKDCRHEINAKWYRENGSRYFTERRLDRRGVTCEWFEEHSKGGCEICGSTHMYKKSLCIDHDHRTNEPRGILCDNCNRLLGLAKSDPDLLRKAIEYLEKVTLSRVLNTLKLANAPTQPQLPAGFIV